jgi:L-histidine Nalpha-methyltransferase
LKIVEQVGGSASLVLYDHEPPPDRLCDDVVRGLTARPRKLPPKYFYDERGARLFERISELDEYYLTRTEISILESRGGEIARRIGAGCRVVEFGSGSGEKTWILLRRLESPAAYIPVDISRTQLVEFALAVNEAFPSLRVVPICADYTADLALPDEQDGAARTVAFFPGSTVGNFEPDEAELFLGRVRRMVGPDGGLLLGLDLRKEPALIEHAYNDGEGVTAEFNLNLLARINRECGASFDLSGFRHHAFFDERESRIEMRLVSTRRQTVGLTGDGREEERVSFDFDAGEFITTEYSYKYDLPRFTSLAGRAGWSLAECWMDENEWFALLLLE